MIKLIVSDVDGTLVEDGSADINPELFEVILKLREKGIQFAIASGRPWSSVEHTFDPVKKKIFYISNNGSYIGCHGRSLYTYTIDKKLANGVIRSVRRHRSLNLFMPVPEEIMWIRKNEDLVRWLVDGYKFKLNRVEDLLDLEEPPVKKYLFYKPDGIEEATRFCV